MQLSALPFQELWTWFALCTWSCSRSTSHSSSPPIPVSNSWYSHETCFWCRTSKINRFNFKRTDLVLDRIKQNHKWVQGWEEKAHKFLYWFTHTELRPVSPYPKVEFTKNSTNHLQSQQFLNTTRTIQPMLKNPISAYLALQETLSRSD